MEYTAGMLRSPALLLALGLAAAGCRTTREGPFSVEKPLEETRRSTTSGEVIGGEGQYGTLAWLGLPFAAPPTGALRWRAPQPPAPWAQPRQALAFGPACPQFASDLAGGEKGDDGLTGAEDCLTLNVWTPRPKPGAAPAKLPVMVWIHGGGNSLGTASFYEPGHLASSQQVMVVTTQYRLGPLGWLRHRSLRAGSTDPAEQSGNFGTLDLVQALEWVKANAAAFGGDPENVTVFGESAGGVNVYSLLLAPQARGLFHRAIVQSGGLTRTALEAAERPAAEGGHENSSAEVLARLLVKAGRAKGLAAAHALAAGLSDEAAAAFLRSRSLQTLFSAYRGGRTLAMISMPLVFPDGAVLPQGDWEARFAQPEGWNRVPVLLGTNLDEIKLFFFLDPRRTARVLGLVPRMLDEPRYLAAAELMSRTWKAKGADGPARAMLEGGWKDVFVYRWDWRGEPTIAGSELSKLLGAAHGLEIPFVFGHFKLAGLQRLLYDEAGAPGRQQLSEAMMGYWATFARTGDPGQGPAGAAPAWTRWDDSAPEAPKFVVLDVAPAGVRMSSAVETMDRVLADLEAEPRLPTAKDKCRVLHDLAGWTRGLTREEYAARPTCAAFPFDTYPWGD